MLDVVRRTELLQHDRLPVPAVFVSLREKQGGQAPRAPDVMVLIAAGTGGPALTAR